MSTYFSSSPYKGFIVSGSAHERYRLLARDPRFTSVAVARCSEKNWGTARDLQIAQLRGLTFPDRRCRTFRLNQSPETFFS